MRGHGNWLRRGVLRLQKSAATGMEGVFLFEWVLFEMFHGQRSVADLHPSSIAYVWHFGTVNRDAGRVDAGGCP